MKPQRAIITYLVLTLLLALLALAITYLQGGPDTSFDAKTLISQTLAAFIAVVSSFGMIIGLNVFAGFLIKWPSSVVLWIPISTVFVLVAHQQIGDYFDLTSLNEIGRMKAFLIYLPAVGLASFAGGLLGMLFGRKT